MGNLLSLVGVFVVFFVGTLLAGVGIGAYLDLSSFLLVFLTSLLATSLAVPFTILRKGFTLLRVALFNRPALDYSIMHDLMAFADKARKEGLLALDNLLDEVSPEFLRDGMQMVIDGMDPKLVRHTMERKREGLDYRHSLNQRFYEVWGKLAPAFGLIGTLIGLISLLSRLEDRTALGSGMALALITTFYGAILANAILIPIKNRLEALNDMELLMMEIIIEGVESLQAGDGPKIMERRLIAFLSDSQRREYLNYAAENPLV